MRAKEQKPNGSGACEKVMTKGELIIKHKKKG